METLMEERELAALNRKEIDYRIMSKIEALTCIYRLSQLWRKSRENLILFVNSMASRGISIELLMNEIKPVVFENHEF